MSPGLRAALFAAAAAPLCALAQLATGVVELREVQRSYAADGVVEAVRQATVAAQIPGRILELRVDAGQTVARGDVLARIDEREAAQALAQSEAQAARAQADLANASAAYERTRQLTEKNFVSKAALDKALAEYRSAQAQLEAARAVVLQANAARSHAVIGAPIAGVVAARHAEPGEMAAPGRPLVTLYDPREMRAVASIPQARLAEVRARPAASVELPALEQRVRARSVTLLPAADARTHTSLARAALPPGIKGAYPGMYVRVHFALPPVSKLVIPASAVVRRSEVTGAYVVGDKGEIAFRQLRLGEPAGEAGIEVLAGVQRGERVALDPGAALARLRQAPR